MEAAFRAESGRVLASLIGVLGDFDLAEDCLQEALATALERWPREGPPRNAAAWLTVAARRKALDRLRRRRIGERKQDELEALAAVAALEEQEASDVDELRDERLRLIFTCCHPALSLEAQVALTLRTLGGLDTGAVARAFLVPEPTLARRLVRAKKKIREARIPYLVPSPEELPQRLAAVLAVIYLLFNEGYAAGPGETAGRRELCTEAIRLARILVALLPEPEALGLLSLLLLHHARFEARTAADGSFVPLEEQDRARWDHREIDEGLAVLGRAAALRRPGPYQTQAAISALHAESRETACTDWAAIADLYAALEQMQPTPVVRLNRAVAVAMAHGSDAGFALLDGLEPLLDGYQAFHGARADLLRRLGRNAEAAAEYRRALALTPAPAEHAYLRRRLEAVEASRR